MKQFDLNEYLEKLQELVNIDSGSRVPGGTEKVADYMEALYKSLGLTVTRHAVSAEVGPCLEIRNRPETERIDVLLAGHMDTVFPAGTVSERPYTQEGDCAYGPGVMDMKGGLISTFYLVKEMLAENLNLSFCVALNSDEEISSTYSQERIKALARKSDYAVILEPGRKNGEYVCERKGLAKYFVEVQGVAAHAGIAPQDGASAIHELSRLILELVKLTDYDKGTSINVGTISGGTAPNVVSAHAECMIDTRFDAIEENQKIEQKLAELTAHPADARVSITSTRQGFRPPMTLTEKSKQLMGWMDEKGAALGMPMKWIKTGGVSDGNFIAFEGCAVVDAAGPSGEGAHSAKEILQIPSIEPRLELLFETMKEMCKVKEGQ